MRPQKSSVPVNSSVFAQSEYYARIIETSKMFDDIRRGAAFKTDGTINDHDRMGMLDDALEIFDYARLKVMVDKGKADAGYLKHMIDMPDEYYTKETAEQVRRFRTACLAPYQERPDGLLEKSFDDPIMTSAVCIALGTVQQKVYPEFLRHLRLDLEHNKVIVSPEVVQMVQRFEVER